MHFHISGTHVFSSAKPHNVQLHGPNNITHIGVVNEHLLHYYQRFGGTHCLYSQGAAV